MCACILLAGKGVLMQRMIGQENDFNGLLIFRPNHKTWVYKEDIRLGTLRFYIILYPSPPGFIREDHPNPSTDPLVITLINRTTCKQSNTPSIHFDFPLDPLLHTFS